MRPVVSIFVICLCLVACKPAATGIPVIQPRAAKMDLPVQAVSIHEVARYFPAQGHTWPIAEGEDKNTLWEQGPILHAAISGTTYSWDLSIGTFDSFPMNPPPPETSTEPIPIAGGPALYAVVSNGGESHTLAFNVNGSSPTAAAIVDGLWIYDQNGGLVNRVGIDASQHELLSGTEMLPLQGFTTDRILLRDARTIPISVSKDVTRLAQTWAQVAVRSSDIMSLDDMVSLSRASTLTGFDENTSWYFFINDSPPGGQPLTYICSDSGAISLVAWRRPDRPDDPAKPLNITGYVPLVRYGQSTFVFADQGKIEPSNRYIVALKLDGTQLAQSNPTIIWESEVPDIFTESIPVADPSGRPYILCLHPYTGNLTVFDPLLGAIRAEAVIYLAPAIPGEPHAKFCIPATGPQQGLEALIHDPNANQMIQIRFDLREPGASHEITPVEK
jgi:hypothetical protein